MNRERTASRPAIDRRTARSAAKVLLSGGALAGLLALVALLPGAGRLLPGVVETLVALAGAVLALAVAGVLLAVPARLAALARTALEGTGRRERAVAESAAAVVHWVAVLAAVLVAHRGVAPVAGRALGGLAWLVDAAFLVAAVPPLVVVAARLYVAVDPAAGLLADRVAGE